GFYQGVDEIYDPWKISLICRDDESTGVAQFRILKYRIEVAFRYIVAGAVISFVRLSAGFTSFPVCSILRFQVLDITGFQCPEVGAAAFNGIAAHFVHIVQQLVTVSAGVVQYRIVERHRVLNGLAEMPGTRFYRVRRGIVRDQACRYNRYIHGSRVTDDLGQDT